jgi:hypothetical protein
MRIGGFVNHLHAINRENNDKWRLKLFFDYVFSTKKTFRDVTNINNKYENTYCKNIYKNIDYKY